MIKTVATVLMALGMLFSVSACNTFAGAGKDIQRGGEKVEETARDVQKKM